MAVSRRRAVVWAEEHGDNYQRVGYDREGRPLRSGATDDAPTSGSASFSSSSSSSSSWLWSSSAGRLLSALFLPVGFPSSVRDEYVEYQLWDTVQALSSYLRGIFSTRAVLASAGVGDETASPLAAAVTWVLRDGLGMVASLALSFGAGSSFDGRLKEWRLFADVINDVGLTLDMAAPLVDARRRPRLFFGVLAAATVCKALCGVAAGSTKASITAHMARSGNTADVAAKEGAQETFVTLVGIVAGVALARALDDSTDVHDESSSGSGSGGGGGRGGGGGGEEEEVPSVVMLLSAAAWSWVVFSALTVLHVYANWRGVTALKLRSLNRHRVALLLAAHQTQTQERRPVGRGSKRVVTRASAMRRKGGDVGEEDESEEEEEEDDAGAVGGGAAMSVAAVAAAEARVGSWLALPRRVARDRSVAMGAPLPMLLATLQEALRCEATREGSGEEGGGDWGGRGEATSLVDAMRSGVLRREKYLLAYSAPPGSSSSSSSSSRLGMLGRGTSPAKHRHRVVCVLLVGASALDELKAYLHCTAVLATLAAESEGDGHDDDDDDDDDDSDDAGRDGRLSGVSRAQRRRQRRVLAPVVATLKELNDRWPRFLRAIRAQGGKEGAADADDDADDDGGWDLERVSLGAGVWRCSFESATSASKVD